MGKHAAQITLAAIVVFAAGEVAAQRAEPSAPNSTPNAQQRAEQLRSVVGMITTPDPNLNLANLEEIVEKKDARLTEIAVRTLIDSDDAVLRGMAMRAYIASAQDIVLEVVLSQQELKVLEAARATTAGVSGVPAPYRSLFRLNTKQFILVLKFREASLRDVRGKVDLPDSRAPVDYVVRGDRITFRGDISFNGWISCSFELRPAPPASITGTMACEHPDFARPVTFIAPMF